MTLTFLRASYILLASLVASCGSTDRQADKSLLAVDQTLSASSQDGHIYLYWTRLQQADRYTVLRRDRSVTEWRVVGSTTDDRFVVPDLMNGLEYQFQLLSERGSKTINRVETAATPRVRAECSIPDCLEHVACFCTQDAANEWMTARGYHPSEFACRGAQVLAWNVLSPNCFYRNLEGTESFLLLRSLGASFIPPTQLISPGRVRNLAVHALWPDRNPFADPEAFRASVVPMAVPILGKVHALGRSYEISYSAGLSSRITRFTSDSALRGKYALYLEGHGGSGVEIGAETIDWLLEHGYEVVTLDMPLVGANSADRVGRYFEGHGGLDRLDQSLNSPVGLFLLPIKAAVDLILQWSAPLPDIDLLFVGRSGGGWSAYTYAAIDERVDRVVSIAGGLPLSQRLKETDDDSLDVGDYEQAAAHLYDVVSHEELMAVAGSMGSLYFFNRLDPCCFRLSTADPFTSYLPAIGSDLGKLIRVVVDETNSQHSLAESGYGELEKFLQ